MTNPYKVLGVSENASDDEIKKAYRRLSRKYHPDANVNNPNKKQAEEKFKEVQQAYDEIQKIKSGRYGTNGGFGDFYGGRTGTKTGDAGEDEKYLKAAIDYINTGYWEQALHVLMEVKNRNGLWYYLSARANLGVGNNVIAKQHAEAAVKMEPDNMEFQQFYFSLNSGAEWYTGRSASYGETEPAGDICMKCCMANLLCNCCCGMRCI